MKIATYNINGIKARLPRDYVPGTRELSWAGVRIPWRVETRDARAQVRFVRHLSDQEVEPTPVAYVREAIAVEVASVEMNDGWA